MTIKPIQGGITAARGFLAAGVHCGLKAKGLDLAVIFSQVPAAGGAMFTTNKVAAAPVVLSRQHLGSGPMRAVVINSGNANACNGEKGMEDARAMAAMAAKALGVKVQQVFVASTGVIGQPLSMDKIAAGIKEAALALRADGGEDAARAIMTTDTRKKEHAVVVDVDGVKVTIGGIAKGSGMIEPNMATMLAFITTDCAIKDDLLQSALKQAVDESFNMITVDGDTSTNDTVIILANGQAQNPLIDKEDGAYLAFLAGLKEITTALAKDIARDGEGATKFIEVNVKGARDFREARQMAKAIANSNLVKTAVFGCDANWGRIICAAGYSGVDFVPDRVDIYLGDEQVAARGAGLPFDEKRARSILQQDEVVITVDLNMGGEMATVWTCDLTYDYIKVNASYRS
ncbi:MAG: bifunctional glutamate N-acetyltransferase/amino-acid acetyltransferase ArgJ [Limnochordia bacterium]|jgi:glutamate N-acetyltransferase/amino-acid N-acetyltransferase